MEVLSQLLISFCKEKIAMNARHRNTHHKHDKTDQAATTNGANASNMPLQRTPGKDDTIPEVDQTAQTDAEMRADRPAGQNQAIDQQRNDEQQYHAAGAAHDPHDQTQQRVDRGDPDAGDVAEVSRSDSAPFNKTYGHHQ